MTVKLPNFPIHVSEVEEQTKEVPTKPVVEVPFPNLPSSISNSLALAEIPIHVFRSKLPSHLFERCTWTSFFYLLHDLVLVSFTFYLATWIDPLTRYYQWSKIANWTLWFFYAIFQGIFCTGLWVIAHECGHQAFSPYKRLNNLIGYILHSSLLVPYHSWRITHGLHHKHTNHLTKDQIFIPNLEKEDPSDPPSSLSVESPLLDFFQLVLMLLGGWPAYLLWNASGQKVGTWQSHFFPSSFFFQPSHYPWIVVSNLGVLGTVLFYVSCGYWVGWWTFFKYSIAPYLYVNMWLIIITYLQHTHPEVPYFNHHSFTFLRGAFATMDRDYGILNHFFHHIGDSHRIHHMFSTMPHYHAIQATHLLKFPKDTTPIWKALWRTFRHCRSVSEHPHHANVFWHAPLHDKSD